MNLADLKIHMTRFDRSWGDEPFRLFHVFERDGRPLHLVLSLRLRKRLKRARLWKSRPMLVTLKNAAYGFDPTAARSQGGADGIFILTRTYRPENGMMRAMFSNFIDKPTELEPVAKYLDTPKADLKAVRLVSHSMRLLGVLTVRREGDWIVLVDYDLNPGR
jgi:hypothetical protein